MGRLSCNVQIGQCHPRGPFKWQREAEKTEAEKWQHETQPNVADLEREEESVSEGTGVASGGWKGKDADFPLEPQEGTWPYPQFDVCPARPTSDSDLQDCTRTYLCCFKPLSLRPFVRAAIRANTWTRQEVGIEAERRDVSAEEDGKVVGSMNWKTRWSQSCWRRDTRR